LSEVGGEAVTVKSLIPLMSNPHLWQPTAAELSTVHTADVFVLSGLGLEAKFNENLDTLRSTGLAVGVLSDVLTEAEIIRPDGPAAPPDPHFWMNASLWAKAAGRAAEVLAAASPEAAAYFQDRAHDYSTQLEDQHRLMQGRFKELTPHARFLISSHDSLRYLAEAHDLSIRSMWNARGEDYPEEETKKTAAWAKEHQVKLLFRENLVGGENLLARMHDLSLPSSKVIISLSLTQPGTLMAGLSEGLDVGKYKSALKYTCEMIYSTLLTAK
ncbi:MAG: zinc ABC transporter substrate-binding protein, partial [Verrucomicrobiaceae bacterium]